MESCLLIYTAVTFVVVVLAVLALRAEIRALANPLRALQSEYKDALTAISKRADRAESRASELGDVLSSFRSAVADKKGLEAAVSAERAQNEFLRERVTELQRALMAFSDRRVEATVVGQTLRGNADPEPPVPFRPSRWQAASGNVPTFEPLVAELTRKNASTTYRPADLAEGKSWPSGLAGLARRESGMRLAENDEAIS